MTKEAFNGTALCKEDMVTEDKEMESERAHTEEEEECSSIPPSVALTDHTVQETAL